jgi:hypothetical protein
MCGQVRLDVGVKIIRFDIWLADSKMATSAGISSAYYEVYHVSVLTPFIRWCQSPLTKSVNSILFSNNALVHILDP